MSQGIYLADAPVRRPQYGSNPLVRKIQRACRLSLQEPDLALNLDVADFVNAKQGAAPREAAIAIVKLVNSRDTHTAVFALALMDVLVKNCGYPFHLQISRKEFLNELVKRFPERPPVRFSKVQRLILTAIEEWYQTICKHAAYKEDLGYVRDMHRLLKYKGYVFPKIREEDLSVLRPTDHLKTPSEIQKEQEIVQAAKLDELIRRGKPEDLKEANKLMKVMAGFKADNALQSKQLLRDELTKLKRKADLFNDMLSTSESPDLNNDTLIELYSALKSSQPKFQKIIEEDQDDDGLVQELLSFNDTVNQLIQKYTLLKTGQSGQAAELHVSSVSSPGATSGTLADELNLIDFGDEPQSSPSPAPIAGTSNTMDDLLGDLNDLSFSQPAPSFGLGGSISLGPSMATSSVSPAPVTSNTSSSGNLDLLAEFSDLKPSQTQSYNAQNDLLGNFSSKKPENQTTDGIKRIEVSASNNLKIEFEITRQSSTSIRVTSIFSNIGNAPISNLTFMLAAPRTMTLRLEPQSGSTLSVGAIDGVRQTGWIDTSNSTSDKPLKVKWKVSYSFGTSSTEESSVFVFPKI
ncbi:LAMI_0E13432g1_1 [Lachancea mirantina]|uniref:LAMI_0E13432g1_1 n=1 Tax=Lachancea mirantina TaxID=1230905 RepID=A0A1G4JQW4_9SACH|nr:LAMI_0E13432g1_1 [Lachancea mirantina]